MIILDELNKKQQEYFELVKKTLDKNSRFYDDDIDSLIKAIRRKTREQLKEAIERQKAINSVSKKEINENCQFEGLI